jgi:hypothetical protein
MGVRLDALEVRREEELDRFEVRQFGEDAVCADPFALARLEEYGVVHGPGS